MTLLVAHDPDVPDEWVAGHVPADVGFTLGGQVPSLSLDELRRHEYDGDVLLVVCSNESESALELVSWWSHARPDHPVIVVCQFSANGFVRQAFAAGADDLVIVAPGVDLTGESARHIGFALQKAAVRKRPAAEGDLALATLICVLGPKGGIGKTVASCNLSVALASRRRRTVLVDLDLQFGDVALSLGLRPERTSYDLAVSGGSLDAEKVEAFLMTHSTGLRVLSAPTRPDHSGLVTAEFMSEVIGVLRTMFDYVIVDTPPTFTPEVIQTIDASSYVCMVSMLDALSLKNARLGLETLELMGYPPDHIRILLNRANTNVGITGADVVSILGRDPDILVPSGRDVARSVNEGEPIVLSQKRSEAAKAFASLADLFHQTAPAPDRRRRGRPRLGRGRG